MSDLRLADLSPRMKPTANAAVSVLTFNCPVAGHTHKIRVHVSATIGGALELEGRTQGVWRMGGIFPDTLTLYPSIDATKVDGSCWHGSIRDGKIV